MIRYLLVVSCVLVTLCRGDHHENAAVSSSSNEQLAGCVATKQQLVQAVNQSMGGTFQEVMVNCLAYQDAQRTVELAVVSGYGDSNSARYIVECRSGLLVVEESLLNVTNETVACHECSNSIQQLCNDSNRCANSCTSCYGPAQSECLSCDQARFNDMCVSQCPNNQSPNPDRGNQCECSEPHRVLPDCECERECEGALNPMTCECGECPTGYLQLVINYTDPVPDGVRGEPPHEFHEVTEEQCSPIEHARRRRAEQHGGGEGGENTTEEPTICVSQQTCLDTIMFGRKDDHNRCYACGLEYCLECTTSSSCTRCREGTLLTGKTIKTCEGFYHVIEERLVELECEERREVMDRDKELLEIKIILPIVCIGTLIVFLGLAVIAHFRYPHVGDNKRHRKPNKKTDVPEHERPWRPQATVRLR